MHFAFLYGPPGVDKLTIGSGLARFTEYKLFHNHLSVNLVTAVFERDSEVYVQLLRRIRRDVLVEAAQHDVSLIMTGVYIGTPVNRPRRGGQCSSRSELLAARLCLCSWFASARSCSGESRTGTGARSTSSSMPRV
jgi:hypothetical protein